MPVRSTPLVTGEIYHIFNRGVDRSNVFRNAHEYNRFLSAIEFYRYEESRVRFSTYLNASPQEKLIMREELESNDELVSLLAFAFMPNHFHLLIKQEKDLGIHQFLFKALNSYAKYINTRRHRVGPLFQGNFRAVRVESEEQLLHVSRYIHLNPVVSGMISVETLASYPWTSYPVYVRKSESWINTEIVTEMIGSTDAYTSFVKDQVAYGKTLADIKRIALDYEDAFLPSTSEVLGDVQKTEPI
jgi:putative transposase